MIHFIMGAVAMGYAVLTMFFLRFWVQTRDRLFLAFGAAFTLLSLNRIIGTMLRDLHETSFMPYIVRLFAFMIIILAIIDKNMRRG